jgi:hypothetical protein
MLKSGTKTNIMFNVNNWHRLVVDASGCTGRTNLVYAVYADKTEETHSQGEEVTV